MDIGADVCRRDGTWYVALERNEEVMGEDEAVAGEIESMNCMRRSMTTVALRIATSDSLGKRQ